MNDRWVVGGSDRISPCSFNSSDSAQPLGDYGKRHRPSATHALAQDYADVDEMVGCCMRSTCKAVQADYQLQQNAKLHSAVIMPAIDTKSREEAITEMNATEKTEVKQRNRRMFGMMLGVLGQFGKRKTVHELEQERKQLEIERRLEAEKEQSRAELATAKRQLLAERHMQNEEIRHLQRKKAIIAIVSLTVSQFIIPCCRRSAKSSA